MGRSALIVKPDELQSEVTRLETEQKFDSIGSLCEAVATSEWGKSIKNSRMQVRGISAQKVYTLLGEMKIHFNTVRGKRGIQKGEKRNRTSRADKLGGNPIMEPWKASMEKITKMPHVPDRVAKIAEKAGAGNLKACVALACMNCHGFESSDYRGCQSKTCPLLPINLTIWPKRSVTVTEDSGFGFDPEEI